MIYLDHAATGLPRHPAATAAAVEAFALGNPGRGRHHVQAAALHCVEQARRDVAALVVGGGTVVFTSGCTAALNQALLGWRPRPALVAVDPLAHNATRRPLHAMGARTWVLPAGEHGVVDVAAAQDSWRDGTQLVVLTHGCNVNGALQPVPQLAQLAHRRGAAVVVDAAQTAGVVVPLDVGPADAVAFSAHKGLRALPGVGALVLRGAPVLEPLLAGGTGGDAVSPGMPDALPMRLEAGTPNVVGIAAMGAAARTVDAWDVMGMARRLCDAVERAGMKPVWGGGLPTVGCVVAGRTGGEVEEMLDRVFGIVARGGLHCAPDAHARLGSPPEGTIRFSAGSSTTQQDLDALTAALRQLGGGGAP